MQPSAEPSGTVSDAYSPVAQAPVLAGEGAADLVREELQGPAQTKREEANGRAGEEEGGSEAAAAGDEEAAPGGAGERSSEEEREALVSRAQGELDSKEIQGGGDRFPYLKADAEQQIQAVLFHPAQASDDPRGDGSEEPGKHVLHEFHSASAESPPEVQRVFFDA